MESLKPKQGVMADRDARINICYKLCVGKSYQKFALLQNRQLLSRKHYSSSIDP